ncbi:dehydrogenase [Reticulibacter mediterranei]|uniref:Dehydrogenase n=1 Tax=Reticulibacter mediterranei TaxID=2778369 RepID=A0A8J3N4X1_9CHLR|nr:NAD(P)-dependent oxidoreductase [Reticulibacter mediterranei]GHO98677.1 dehydrogenase [Reticulibacter mediterranei]
MISSLVDQPGGGRADPPLGFLGLGHMGLPIARQLVRHGYSLRVYDPDPRRVALLLDEDYVVANSPGSLAFSSHLICSMVPDDASVEQIIGELAPRLSNGVHLSLSTISPQLSLWALKQYQQAGRGSHFVSATVLGRPPLAEQGRLTVFVCGEASAKARVRPLLECLGSVYDLGDRPDAAALVKLMCNGVIVSSILGLGYAAAFLRAEQINPAPILALLAQTPLFTGTVFQEYGQMIGHDVFQPTRFPVPLGLKDVQLILSQGVQNGTQLPLIELAQDLLLQASQSGWGELDWSVMGRVITARQPTGPLSHPLHEQTHI